MSTGYVYWWNPTTMKIVAIAEVGDPVPKEAWGMDFAICQPTSNSSCSGELGCTADPHMLYCPALSRRAPRRRDPLPDPVVPTT